MDSSSDFGPVGRGFMVFHFCKKTGCFRNVSFLRENIFSGWFRAKDAKDAKVGKKGFQASAGSAGATLAPDAWLARTLAPPPRGNYDAGRLAGSLAPPSAGKVVHCCIFDLP